MSAGSKIEWTRGDDGTAGATWNPVTGCSEVSEGCDHCYAKTFAERWRGVPGHPFEQGFDVRLWPDRLEKPLRWRKPRRVFVNSMSDLFMDADKVPDEFVARVFAAMAAGSQHTFQVLTKRPARMRSLLCSNEFRAAVCRHWTELGSVGVSPAEQWPLPNVWLGVSVETQKWARVRLPRLAATPAVVRFASCEPLLGPLELRPWLGTGLDWVIAGGESGAGHRPLDLSWVRALRDQCQTTGVAFFFKQVGGRTPKAGGRELDGRTWDKFPQPRREAGLSAAL